MVISHSGGYEAYYCGLGDTTLVSAGDSVYPGQDIGSVKEIPSEVLDASHLHFGVKRMASGSTPWTRSPARSSKPAPVSF